MRTLVFDNTPLSHFARAGQLEVLHAITHGFRSVVPTEVAKELVIGIPEYPSLSQAVDREWLESVEIDEITEVVRFARYKAEFGGGVHRNNGESAVLAWASVHNAIAIVDDAVASRAARRDDIEVHGTLWLVANGVRDGNLKRDAATRIVDLLASTDMRLPVDGAGFFAWAYEEGLLP